MSFTAGLAEDALTEGVITRRVIAWLIDAALLGIILSALWVFSFLFGVLTLGLGFGLMAALPVVPAIYNVLFLASPGSATPGQRMMGLTVRRESDLGRPNLLQAILSTGGFLITMATGVIWLAVALVTPHRRTLHDMVAGLVVVNAKRVPTGGVIPGVGAWYPRA